MNKIFLHLPLLLVLSFMLEGPALAASAIFINGCGNMGVECTNEFTQLKLQLEPDAREIANHSGKDVITEINFDYQFFNYPQAVSYNNWLIRVGGITLHGSFTYDGNRVESDCSFITSPSYVPMGSIGRRDGASMERCLKDSLKKISWAVDADAWSKTIWQNLSMNPALDFTYINFKAESDHPGVPGDIFSPKGDRAKLSKYLEKTFSINAFDGCSISSTQYQFSTWLHEIQKKITSFSNSSLTTLLKTLEAKYGQGSVSVTMNVGEWTGNGFTLLTEVVVLKISAADEKILKDLLSQSGADYFLTLDHIP